MLVYHKNPMGYTTIDNTRVYGKHFNYGRFGPANIPYKEYWKNKDILKEFKYTNEWFNKKFDSRLPPFSFTASNLRFVDFRLLIKIARVIGFDYQPGISKLTQQEKRAMRRTFLKKLDKIDY